MEPHLTVFWEGDPRDPRTWMAALLALSGDIEVNPGSSKTSPQTFTCNLCNKIINKNQYSILCNSKNPQWIHKTCSKINLKQYHQQWTCFLHPQQPPQTSTAPIPTARTNPPTLSSIPHTKATTSQPHTTAQTLPTTSALPTSIHPCLIQPKHQNTNNHKNPATKHKWTKLKTFRTHKPPPHQQR